MLEALRSALLVSGLVFPGIAAYTAVYVAIGAMIVLVSQVRNEHLRSPAVYGIAAAIVAVLVSILLNGASPDDWVALALVLPFIAVVPTAAGLMRVDPRMFATLCLLGAVAALILGLVDIFAFNLRRAGGDNNPIHYASLAGMLGMVALIGAFGTRDRLRYLFLLGPAAAFATALLSGSRGPLLADCVMFAIALVAFWRDRRFFLALLAFPIAGGLVLLLSGEGQRALILFTGVLSESTRNSDAERIMMLQAAGEMLATSPLWGHGYADFMDTARTLQPIRERFDNLHADISNLAAVAGVLGIVAYCGMIGAPLLSLISRAARADRSLVFLALLVSAGNAALGLTNAVIGVLPQTTLLVLMTGYVVARERQAVRELAPLPGEVVE